MAHGRRLQAAAAVLCFFQCFPVTLPVWFSSSFQLFLPLPMFWSSFFSSLGFSLLSVFPLSLLCFFFCFLLLLRPLYSLLSSFSLRLFPPFLSVLGVLFIEPRAWLCWGAWGATGRSAIGHDCQGSAPLLLGFLAGARWVVGHCVRSVGSRRESGRKKFKKSFTFPSSPLRDRGKKMNSVVQNDTVLLFLSLFFFFLTV